MILPQIVDVKNALRIYYEKTELGNKEIAELFGTKARSTIGKIKKIAQEKMAEENTPFWDPRSVNTEVAFRAWGLNIDNLERRYKKLKSLGLIEEGE